MTNNTPVTLNFSLLEGLEPGTDEFGQANLKMMMDFALQTVDEITWLAAIANDKGQVDTPVVSYEGMVKHIASELYDQSVQHAELWAETYETIYPEDICRAPELCRYRQLEDDHGLRS